MIREELRNKNRLLMDIVLILLTVNAFVVIGIALRCFVNPKIETAALYNAGVDVLGAFLCPVLFYGCMGDRKDKEQPEDATRWFMHLIILTAISFLFNANEWYVIGDPTHTTRLQVAASLTKIIDFLLTYCFYRYVRESLDFEGKLARWFE